MSAPLNIQLLFFAHSPRNLPKLFERTLGSSLFCLLLALSGSLPQKIFLKKNLTGEYRFVVRTRPDCLAVLRDFRTVLLLEIFLQDTFCILVRVVTIQRI